MPDKKSLVKLAYEAGFNNIHDLAGASTWLIGSIMSDKYKIIMFRGNDDLKTQQDNSCRRIVDAGTVDVLGIVDPYEYDSCALFRLRVSRLIEAKRRFENQPLNCWISLDNKEPLYGGQEAAAVLEGLSRIK